ncbi:hypothetical protein B0T26DRAFT_799670 [Lasiosphaeria miniovina]|uniref:Uncharacterized protein n=1 Tax=Lasiosphaeria miniovina TaxID=1954250 RepID=A0AA40E9W6_9PEZI|nr:uncharacterized protein B0T26DRAFT_799670 [Lasiosphaeria miniovina]KAK0727743.1 hypothetical protein B0T26DRAFT_799670 [Lasiosphaeria miniovina]
MAMEALRWKMDQSKERGKKVVLSRIPTSEETDTIIVRKRRANPSSEEDGGDPKRNGQRVMSPATEKRAKALVALCDTKELNATTLEVVRFAAEEMEKRLELDEKYAPALERIRQLEVDSFRLRYGDYLAAYMHRVRKNARILGRWDHDNFPSIQYSSSLHLFEAIQKREHEWREVFDPAEPNVAHSTFKGYAKQHIVYEMKNELEQDLRNLVEALKDCRWDRPQSEISAPPEDTPHNKKKQEGKVKKARKEVARDESNTDGAGQGAAGRKRRKSSWISAIFSTKRGRKSVRKEHQLAGHCPLAQATKPHYGATTHKLSQAHAGLSP